MDPISVIGILCELLKLSNNLYQLARNLKEGDTDLLELCHDVSFFEEALKGFDRVLRDRRTSHNISISVIATALQESTWTIQALQDKLSHISRTESSALRRLKWLQNKSYVKKLHERVKIQSTMLQCFLTLAQTESFLKACSNYPEFLYLCSSGENLSPTAATSLAPSDTSEKSSLASRASLASFSCASVSTNPSSTQSCASSLQETGSETTEAFVKLRDVVSRTEPPILRKACRFDCYCCCHSRDEARNGGVAFLKKSISQLALSGLPCDNPNCQPERTTNEIVVSVSHFFQRALPHVAAAHRVKARYHIDTFHIVPESSDVMRYTKQGDLDSLKAAIVSGKATIWDTAPDGWSLLHTAVYNRQLPIVKYLLELGASTEVADIGARRPADLAILNSLVSGAARTEHDINKTFTQKDDYLSDFDFTPIHIAVLDLYDLNDYEHPSLEQLLELVDDCNNAAAGTNWTKLKSNYKKRSPLYGSIIEYFRASAYEQPKNFKAIYNLVDQKDKSLCWTPLHWACATGKSNKVKSLIYHGADPFILSNLNANIIHAAAESKTLGGLDDALNIWRSHPERLNIDQPNHWGESPLHVAAWGSVENVRKLVQAGANRNVRQEDGQVPLHCTGMTAKGKVRMQIIDLLCRGYNGDHINAQDKDGRPPLFDFLDDSDCVERLINYGAKLDLLDGIGRSVFHHACIQNNEETLKTLLRLSPAGSVLVTIKDHEGNTALILALRHRSRGCALRLLQLDDVGDMVGQDGWSAVHHAAKFGDPDVLEAVLHHQKQVKGMKTIDGKTAEVVAMETGNWRGEVKDLLRRYNSIT